MQKQDTIIKRNTQAVITSAIIAKAAVRRPSGRIELIVIFQSSTRHEFYWSFSARSLRSPRRSWKTASYYERDVTFGQFSAYKDFGSFVGHYARTNQAQVLYVRVLQKRRLSALLAKTDHESIFSDWTPQDMTSATFNKVGKAHHPRGFYFNSRNKLLDEFSQSPNEVLVYEDWCEECIKRHSYAHFPDGQRKCKVGYLEMKGNPGFEYRGFNNATGFRFTYRTFVGAGA